jgi:multidrug efflux pump subunit AcrB
MKKTNNIPSFSIIVIFVLLSVIGMALIPRLNVSLVPSRTLPSVTVTYQWYNTSARIIENEVTTKLETLFSSIKGVRQVESKTTKSSGYITVSFDEDVDMDAARFQVSSSIRQAYSKFPEGISYPSLSVNTPNEEKQSLLSYTIFGPAPAFHIQKYAGNNIKPDLSNLQGVNEVNVYGATPFEWFITYEPDKLHTLDISTHEIRQAIRHHFETENLGYSKINEGPGQQQNNISIRLNAVRNNKQVWERIAIKKAGDRVIYLTDIAKIRYQQKKPNYYYRINGMNTVNLVVYPEKHINSLKLAKTIKAEVRHMEQQFPPGYSIRKMYDATEFINKELRKVGIRTIIAVIVLLGFVLLISRRLKYLLLITISLVVNLAIAVIFYYASRLEIHIYSLAGMTISLGIIIDNSIIMADHIRHQHNRKVFLPILAATLTTIGALSLVFFLNQKQQLNLIDFSLIIIINLVVSLFIALFFIPSLLEKINLKPRRTRRFFRRKKKIIAFSKIYERWIGWQVRYKWLFIVLLILAFGTPIYMLPAKIDKETPWAGIYNSTLGTDFYQNRVREHTDKYLGGTLRLFSEYVYESSFYSEPGRTKLYVQGKMPEGSTIQQINAAVEKIENYLNQFDEIGIYQTQIRSYRNARISILIKPEFEKGYFPFALKGNLIAKANSLGGMDWSIYGVGKGFSNAVNLGYKDSRIYLYGYNYEQLYEHAESLKERLSKNRRVKELDIRGRSNWFSAPLRHKFVADLSEDYLNQLGYSPMSIYNLLSEKTLQTTPIGRYFLDDQLENINLEAETGDFDMWDLQNTPLAGDTGMIKMNTAGEIIKQRTGNDIFKKNQEYQLAVEFNFAGPGPLRDKVMEKHLEETNNLLPLGYRAQLPQWRYWSDDGANKAWMLSLVIFIIFFICSILFESLKQPLVILSLVPLSFIGVFLTFYLFDINFDQGGYASFILLAGITVNTSIYIINEYNNLPPGRRTPTMKSYVKAFNLKIVPILLTITSTILGLIPFLIGGQNEAFWFAFAAGSIGGLIFSLAGIFFFLPAFFIKRNIKKAPP